MQTPPNTKCIRFWAITGAIILTASACASPVKSVQVYPGPARPDTEVAKVLVPPELEILTVDGEDIEVPFADVSDYELRLLPGPHELVMVYQKLWGNEAQAKLVVSDAVGVQLDAKAASSYQLEYEHPRNVDAAEQSARDFKVWVVDPATGQRTESYFVESYGPPLNRALRNVFSKGDKPGTQRATPVPNPAQASVTAGATSASGNSNQDPAVAAEQVIAQQDALDRLKFWWKLADDKQKRAFRIWIVDGSPN
jgi:uncharacterized protein YccT (UPF0319 family)